MALGNRLIRTLAAATLAALALAACGAQQAPPTATTGTTASPPRNNRIVRIYSSLPYGGPERADSLQIEEGIRLALRPTEHRLYHGLRVDYRALNDSYVRRMHHGRGANSPSTRDRSSSAITTTSAGNSVGWNPTAAVDAAEIAARNPQTVAYIGDLDSGATELSLPILNQAGILQITPGSGYPGLTDSYKNVTLSATEPGRYYPHSPRNLLRLIPNDVVQAAAALSLLHASCQTFSAWSFSSATDQTENAALLAALIRTAPEYAMKYVAPPKPLGANTKSYDDYVRLSLEPEHLQCVVLVGEPTGQAVAFTMELRLQMPSVAIVGSSGFCSDRWINAIPKTYLKTVEAGLSCTTPALPVTRYPGAKGSRGFIAAFRRAFHRQPSAYAYYGYQSARMVLRALQQIGPNQDKRQEVLQQLAGEFPSDASEPLTFEGGNVTLNEYGVDDFKNGALRPYRTVTPPYYLLSSG